MVEMRANLQPRISTAQTPRLALIRRRPAPPTTRGHASPSVIHTDAVVRWTNQRHRNDPPERTNVGAPHAASAPASAALESFSTNSQKIEESRQKTPVL